MGDLRYADAGVDIDEGNRAVSLIRRTIASTHTGQVLGGIGAFSGLFALEPGSPDGRVLASSTDSVGTKVKVAIATGRHRGIGIDLVNHCVNDILCCGADPLFFLDYYATGKLVPEHLAELIEGIAEACRAAGCALIGGETAEMPGVYALGDYDIAGFIVGSVTRSAIIDGSRVKAGDVLLALPSSGLHTNGYSLVRHIVAEHELQWSDVLPGHRPPARRPPSRAASLLPARDSRNTRAHRHPRDGAHHGRWRDRQRATGASRWTCRHHRAVHLGRAGDLRRHSEGRWRASRGDVAHLQHGRRAWW